MPRPNDPAKPVELECGHTLWLRVLPERLEETLYCKQCEEYREIAPKDARLPEAWIVHAEDRFASKRIRMTNQYEGRCLHEECEHTTEVRGWFRLRDSMHIHYMRMHTRFGSIDLEIADRLPKGSKPPF